MQHVLESLYTALKVLVQLTVGYKKEKEEEEEEGGRRRKWKRRRKRKMKRKKQQVKLALDINHIFSALK